MNSNEQEGNAIELIRKEREARIEHFEKQRQEIEDLLHKQAYDTAKLLEKQHIKMKAIVDTNIAKS